MDTAQFLDAILSPDGYYCVVAINKDLPVGDPKKVRRRFLDSTEDVIKAARQIDQQGLDAYFAVSTYEEKTKRVVRNVKHVRALFLDIDCGDKKDYPTQRDGIKALQKFCKTLCLPRPTMVSSGRGIHVYWQFAEPVSYEQWLPVAEKLKRRCKEHGFKADPSVTADGARILRVPGTHNHKDPTPKPVEILAAPGKPVDFDVISDLLGDDEPLLPVVSSKILQATKGMDAALAGLNKNTVGDFKLILKKTQAGEGCNQIRIIATEQATVDEPLWRAGLSVAKCCENAEKAAHMISCKHPEYDPEETLDKMNGTTGPQHCTTFNDINPGICEECPNWKKITSPIQLGKKIKEAKGEDKHKPIPPKPVTEEEEDEDRIPEYPFPYVRGKNGGVYKRESTDDGEELVEIYPYDLYAVQRIWNPNDGASLMVRMHLPQDGVREFSIPAEVMQNRSNLQAQVGKMEIVANSMPAVGDYLVKWVQHLQATSVAKQAALQFGWANDHNSFIIGNTEYTTKGRKKNHASSATLDYMPYFEPKGTLEGWKEVANFWNRDKMELHQFALCTAFGSPLIEFISNVQAGCAHLYSKESGRGKTMALWAAASVWGNYKELCTNAKDTNNFLFNRGDVYKNIPLCVDELTSAEPKWLSDFVLEITHGKQKGRMTSQANKERVRGAPWSLLALTTGNKSINEAISRYKQGATAEAQRILEIRADLYPKFEDKAQTDALNDLIAENYGFAGPVFIQWVLNHKKQVIKLLKEEQARIDKECGLTQQDRFWSAYIACVIVGAKIAKHLGLIDYNISKLFRFCKKVLARAKMGLTGIDLGVSDIISQYLTENVNNRLEVDGAVSRQGSNQHSTKNTPPHVTPKGDLNIRVELKTDNLYLRVAPFKAWLIDRQLNYEDTAEKMRNLYGAQIKPFRIGKGTDLKVGNPVCIYLKGDRLDFDIDDDSTEDQ